MGWGLSLLLKPEEGLASVKQKDLLTSAGHWGLEGGGPRLRLLGERWSTQIHGARGTCRAFTDSRAENGLGLHHPRPTPWRGLHSLVAPTGSRRASSLPWSPEPAPALKPPWGQRWPAF